MRKKAQAALEFLLTYGWAILVILVMIGALSYFGIFDVDKLFPSKCILGQELVCESAQVSQNGVELLVRNNAGKELIIKSATLTYKKSQRSCSVYLEDGRVRLSQLNSISLVCDMTKIDGKENLEIELVYNQVGSGAAFDKTIAGEVYETKTDTMVFDPTGLVLLMHFDNKKVDGESASLTYDYSREVNVERLFEEENNGTVLSAAFNSSGKFDGAYDFDPTLSSEIRVDDDPSLEEMNALTVSAWIYPRVVTDSRNIVQKESTFNLRLATNTLEGWHNSGSWTLVASSTTLPNTFEWSHVAYTWSDGNAGNMYLNGVDVTTTSNTASGPTQQTLNRLSVGGRIVSSYFNGLIDEVAVFNRSLSAQEIQTLYRLGKI